MVTAYARLRLLDELHKIEASSPGRVLYFDTDSVIFMDNPSNLWYKPHVGGFLGDMTDEIEADYGGGAYIESFASGGPKNYGYSVRLPDGGRKEKVKVKGISITDDVKDHLTYATVSEFSIDFYLGNKQEKYVEQLQFRAIKTHQMFTSEIEKKYRVVSEKRRLVDHPTYQTLPFGYKD